MAKASDPLKDFDPNSASNGEGVFGLPFNRDDSKVVVLAAPFEATTSYLGGTSKAPKQIFEASQQVDLFHPHYGDVWKKGIYLDLKSIAPKIQKLNQEAKRKAVSSRKTSGKRALQLQKEVNKASEKMNQLLSLESRKLNEQNKIVGVLGGDHSVPFSNIAECLNKFPEMGVLHLDAHFDLRSAYEGFIWSHASIFYNVMTRLPLKRLVQVGLRDFSEAEFEFANQNPQLKHFTWNMLFTEKARGQTWDRLCDQVLESLPKQVYLSLDIDGLEQAACPATGTPVPGGLSYSELSYLIDKLVASGRKIVGFDLVEVGPSEWDANVGARLLWQICLASLASQKLE